MYNCTVDENIFWCPIKMDTFTILRQQYLSFRYCSPFSFRSSNFAIAKVVALNLFASFFVSDLMIGSWLLFCIASYIVIALPNYCITTATVVALLRAQSCERIVKEIFLLSKRDNIRESNQEKKQRADFKNKGQK